MKYKMVAVDLDGTLLTNDKIILESTKNKIREMVKKGFVFTFATGRPKELVLYLVEQLNIDMPLILYNGGLITFSNSNEIIYNCLLKESSARKIIKLIDSINAEYSFYSEGKLYVNKLEKNTITYINYLKRNPVVINGNNDIIPYDKISKIICFQDENKLIELEKSLDKGFDDVNYFTSNTTFLEFVDKEVDKLNGIIKICDYYNFNLDEVIAIGDGFNDLSMIKGVGLGVAMKNSKDEIKKEAKYVTINDNNHDGVGEVIDKFILNN